MILIVVHYIFTLQKQIHSVDFFFANCQAVVRMDAISPTSNWSLCVKGMW